MMTIEELKLLRTQVRQDYDMQVPGSDEKDAELAGVGDYLIDLIDAEIERQSVTDVDVAEVIRHLKYWQLTVDPNEEYLEYLEDAKMFVKACSTAIIALQAYHKPESTGVYRQLMAGEGASAIYSLTCKTCHQDLPDDYECNFCPNCGRRLEIGEGDGN